MYFDSQPTVHTSASSRINTALCVFVLHLRLPLSQAAKAWQAANDTAYKGPAGNFSRGQDRRLLWASYEAQVGDTWRLQGLHMQPLQS